MTYVAHIWRNMLPILPQGKKHYLIMLISLSLIIKIQKEYILDLNSSSYQDTPWWKLLSHVLFWRGWSWVSTRSCWLLITRMSNNGTLYHSFLRKCALTLFSWNLNDQLHAYKFHVSRLLLHTTAGHDTSDLCDPVLSTQYLYSQTPLSKNWLCWILSCVQHTVQSQ